MHILLLPSWYPKNSNDVRGVFFRDQALALKDHGHIVGVVAPSMRSLRTLGKPGSNKYFPLFEHDNGVLTYRKEQFAAFPGLPYGNYWLFKRVAKELLKRYIADNGKPEILHAHAAVFAGAAGAELSKEFDIPLVLTEHSTGFARQIYGNWELKLAKRAIEAANRCIAVSPALANVLRQDFPESKVSWKWIPNVVADRFKEPRRSDKNDRPLRFLNLALMTEKKGQFDLLKAFFELTREGLNSELWLGGDGPIRPELERLAERAGIANKVRFLGLVQPDKVPELLAQIDVMVVSSHYETFGVVAAEALMAGVPVVATRCGGPECIVEGGDGLLVPPKRPDELTRAMAEVGTNLIEYDPKILAARAKERFSGSSIAKRLTIEYENVLSSCNYPADGG